ncbi:Sister chromatid cohesion C-terminus domain containing protein [Rhypophila decipiens]
MASPRPSSQKAPIGTGKPGNNRPSGSDAVFTRPFAFHEALPYTSFTSIIPFDSSVLPAPSIGSASPAPSLQDLTPRNDFDFLNREVLEKGASSKLVQQTFSQVQRLIERGNITEFKFKTAPKNTSDSSKTKARPNTPGLAPFSKMLYDQSAIPFRYPTPDTASATPNGQLGTEARVPNKQSVPVVSKASASKQVKNMQKNKQAHAQNLAKLEIVLPTKSQLEQAAAGFKPSPRSGTSVASASPKNTPQPQPRKKTPSNLVSPRPEAIEDSITVTPVKTTPQAVSGSQKKSGIAVELPQVPFDKSQFLAVAVPDEPEEPVNLSTRKRKRADIDDDDIYGESLGLRQRADAAFRELRVFLQGIFEAEQAALRSEMSNDSITLINEKEATLTSAAQSKAQTLLGKTITLNCFRNAPLEDLLRLFRLSESALKLAESLDIKIEESWTGGDVEQWVEQLPILETALRAARTSLRMMCGGRGDKQLYSEDVIDRSLNLFKRVVEGIVMPVAELRTADSTAQLFRDLSSYKKKIASLFNDAQKLFSLMATLIGQIDVNDTVSNTLEFIASRLIFIETAHAERESVIDTQKFDGFRLVAMDMLSQIFLLNPSQRRGIFDEILTSLEKLPLGKRARTFKLVDGTSIQPVSALMMRLVQTSAGQVKDGKLKGHSAVLGDDGEEDDDEPLVGKPGSYTIRDERDGAAQHSTAIQELSALAGPLIDTARLNASYVVNYIVNRALKSTKSGDEPYRNLLDLFVEDFTSCLDNPDWPGAGLLLMILTSRMFTLVDDNNKASTVTAKNMALELLGVIGAAISKLRAHVRKTANAMDTRDADDLGRFLSDLACAALDFQHRPDNMVAWTGPYRATLEYLESRFSEDQHLGSAITFLISDWSHKVCFEYDAAREDVDERDEEYGRLAYRLREMIQDRRWLSKEFSFKEVSSNQAKLAYSVSLLGSQLCRSFDKILRILLTSTGSDQPTVRSKSLKSINQVLDTDPSILDGESVVIQLILRCTNDSSTQVRDSALGLIGKCIGMRPKLEDKMVGMVVDRFIDTGLGVRKRAMKLGKDIYIRNHNKAVKSAIANGLLHRVQDPEESVRDLARQVIEEIWFSPFYSGEDSAETKTSLAEHVALMIHTVNQGNVTNVLDKVLQGLFASKTSHASLEVCRKLVSSMFDLVDKVESNDPTVPSGRSALQVLMIFAKAEPALFTFEQLRLLMPHIESIKSSDDLAVSRAVVVIYRRVLPQLSSAHGQFLQTVRGHLQAALPKVTRTLLDDIVPCLWIISTLLKDHAPMAVMTGSSLAGILGKMNPKTALAETPTRQFERYSLIIGMVGKHCDLDGELERVKQRIKQGVPKWTGGGSSVSEIMVQVLLPFAGQAQPLDVRKAALDSVGLVCQSWPRNYASARVYTTFQQVFESEVAVLENMVLRSLKEFLFLEEKRSEQTSEKPSINGASKPEKKRELTVMGGTNYDDVASGTARRFLASIIRIAKATQDEHAFLAVEVLASINRQGLTHPKETGVTFITLETSTNPRISELAFLEHKALHAKHETVIEREYPSALKEVYAYQRDIVKDARGATANPFVPKLNLMMEVLKISKSKNRQKFLEKLCNQIDFDLVKLEKPDERTQHVQYSCFLADNLAFFEYLTVGEVHSTVSLLEKLVTSTGANVAQVIESEVFQVRMDAIDANPVAATTGDAEAQPAPTVPDVELKRLQQLTAASMILLILWEVRSHLRRLYGMGTGRIPKPKDKSKDLSKAPVKAASVTGDKVWEEVSKIMASLGSRELMMETCKTFVELMNVDKDFVIQEEEDDDDMNGGEDGNSPLEIDEDEDEKPSAGRGRKRKAGGATPGGRKNKRARSSSQPRKRGRPRKQSMEADADGEVDEEYF